MFERGKIVLVPFPFTDLCSSKIRPALIISDPKLTGEDVTVVFISSNISRGTKSTDYTVGPTHPHYQQTGLKIASVIRCGKVATLDKKIVLGEIGSLPSSVQKEIDRRIRLYLGLAN